MINEHADVLISDELKSIYFGSQDTVLTEEGILLTCNLDSNAIEKIKQVITTHHQDYPALLGKVLRVVHTDALTITEMIERLTRQGQGPRWDDKTLSTIGRDVVDMLSKTVERGASDIHIELYAKETRLLIRVDGRLVELRKAIPEYEYGNNLIGYLFNEKAQDTDGDFYVNKTNNGRIVMELDTPYKDENGETHWVKRDTLWRISYIYAKDKGGQATLRWLNKDLTIPKLDSLGWEPGHVAAMRAFMHSASGACLMAGQVGSGKTTAIASALSEVKDSGRAINTIEDPVEVDIGVMQTSVQGDNDELDALVRLLLRHDGDIEFHGEMRTQAGAMAVCRKAETGQLMLATLHTSSASGIAHTMNEQMAVPLALITAPDLMKLWIYQTLVRTLCPHCSLTLAQAQAHWTSNERAQFERWQSVYEGSEALRFRHREGCEHCIEGEKGRTSLVEMIVLDDEDRHYIIKKDYLNWEDALKKKGFKSVLDHANLKIKRGEVDLFTASERVNGLFEQAASSVYATFFEEAR